MLFLAHTPYGMRLRFRRTSVKGEGWHVRAGMVLPSVLSWSTDEHEEWMYSHVKQQSAKVGQARRRIFWWGHIKKSEGLRHASITYRRRSRHKTSKSATLSAKNEHQGTNTDGRTTMRMVATFNDEQHAGVRSWDRTDVRHESGNLTLPQIGLLGILTPQWVYWELGGPVLLYWGFSNFTMKYSITIWII